MPVFPGLGTYQQIVESGVISIAAWLEEAFPSLTEREAYLKARYPSANKVTIANVANYLFESTQAARELQESGTLPNDVFIPRNPNIPEGGGYQVDVKIKIPDPERPGKYGGGLYRITVPEDIDSEDVRQYVDDYISEKMQEGDFGQYSEITTDDDIDLSELDYQLVFIGVSRV